MTEGPRMEVVGARDAFADVARVVDKVAGDVEAVGVREAQRLVSLVVPKVPKVSGRMADSLGVEHELGGAAAGYDGSAPYAAYVEFGGSHGRPYVGDGRYLYPTARGPADAFERELAQVTDDEIRRYRWSKPR